MAKVDLAHMIPPLVQNPVLLPGEGAGGNREVAAPVAVQGNGHSSEVTESVTAGPVAVKPVTAGAVAVMGVTAAPVAVKPVSVKPLKAAPLKDEPAGASPASAKPGAVTELPAQPEVADRPGPKYQSLERKEVFLWPDQRDDLDGLERRLNRARGRGNGERITANTLIRVAVDLLLERQADLVGVSEEDLRTAMGLPGRQVAVGE